MIAPNTVVREYVESGLEWEHAKIAKTLYGWGDIFRDRFFLGALPQPLIAVALHRVDNLASYRLVPNPDGLPYEITLNSLHIGRPMWSLLETLLHEMVHLYHETTDGLVRSKPPHHNKVFVELCENLGLHPKLGEGCHLRPADGRFAELMAEYGVEKPADAAPVEKGNWFAPPKVKGRSSLLKYICSCPAPHNSIRSARKELNALCQDCGEQYAVA